MNFAGRIMLTREVYLSKASVPESTTYLLNSHQGWRLCSPFGESIYFLELSLSSGRRRSWMICVTLLIFYVTLLMRQLDGLYDSLCVGVLSERIKTGMGCWEKFGQFTERYQGYWRKTTLTVSVWWMVLYTCLSTMKRNVRACALLFKSPIVIVVFFMTVRWIPMEVYTGMYGQF